MSTEQAPSPGSPDNQGTIPWQGRSPGVPPTPRAHSHSPVSHSGPRLRFLWGPRGPPRGSTPAGLGHAPSVPTNALSVCIWSRTAKPTDNGEVPGSPPPPFPKSVASSVPCQEDLLFAALAGCAISQGSPLPWMHSEQEASLSRCVSRPHWSPGRRDTSCPGAPQGSPAIHRRCPASLPEVVVFGDLGHARLDSAQALTSDPRHLCPLRSF